MDSPARLPARPRPRQRLTLCCRTDRPARARQKSLSLRCLSHAAALFDPPSPSSSSPSSQDPTRDPNPVPPPLTSLSHPLDPPTAPSTPQWTAIRTHLHHALARQSYTVGAARASVEHFLALLGTGAGAGAAAGEAEVDDAAAQAQPEWLDDFALAWELRRAQLQLRQGQGEGEGEEGSATAGGVRLPVRLFDAAGATLRVGSARAAGAGAGGGAGTEAEEAEDDAARWAQLERALLDRAEFAPPAGSGGRPSALSYRGDSAGAGAGAAAGRSAVPVPPGAAAPPVEAVLGETLVLEVPVRNPLEEFLALGGLAVEVRREGGAEEEGSGGEGLEVSAPQDVELAPGETSKVRLSLFRPFFSKPPAQLTLSRPPLRAAGTQILIPIRASALGTYTLDSLSYRFSNLVPVHEPLSPARWSKPTAPRPGKPSTREPRPLRVTVRGAVPVLRVEVGALPARLFHGEEARGTSITLRNEGPAPLTDLHALASDPDFVLVSPLPPRTLDRAGLDDAGDAARAATLCLVRTPNDLSPPGPAALLLPAGRALAPGESLSVPVAVRGAHVGAHALRVLFAFRAAAGDDGGGGADDGSAGEYFSTRAVHRVEVYPSVEVRYALRPGRRDDSPLVLGVEVRLSRGRLSQRGRAAS